ncbi:ABC transporter ATP-binding protein [Candidatus Njordibacter sp. Uisw_039]|jgi:putrescine transport system ATP-binding protein|uniref:ABC transporter ATP-binding protein n=1 Tax=Candidatus Njordibacter sp. Uisw_039 TaxID=3230972 RepID=UPI003A30F388|tara:strand:+ start:616 stop:1758 length:1143 start_codon:yes stop_codon:yes gene_type:complete
MSQQTNYSDRPWLDADAEPFIKIRSLSKKFGEFTAVDNIDLDIYKGELFSLLGGSGCGKTTLLRMLAGFETPSSGTIYIDGVDMTEVPPYARPINMMFQSYALFPHMTVEQNVAYGLKRDKIPKDEIKRRVDEILSMVELSDFIKRKPHQLSGGQRQRVALARALVKQPKVLLLDEPLGALDKRLREQTQFELINIQDQLGVTFVVVTHDQEEAMTLSTRMAMMDAGKFQQIGTPTEVYEYPDSRLVANFIGSANMFEGRVSQSGADHIVVASKELEVELYTDHAMSIIEGTKVWVAVRPEKITLSKTSLDATTNQLKGVVVDIGYHGKTSTYRIRISNDQIIEVSVPSQKRPKGDRHSIDWDEEIYLNWDQSSAVVLMK